MARTTALVMGSICLLLVGLARESEAANYGVELIFSSSSPDFEGFPPPLNGISDIGSAASPEMSIDGDLVKNAFVDTREGFALGIGVNYSVTPELDEANVRALAATAFTVQGDSPVPIPASVRLSGNFQGDLFDPSSYADIQLRVYEFDPNDPAGFDGGDLLGMDVVLPFFFQGPAEFTKFRRASGDPFDELLGEGLWIGSETLEFNLPASGMGLFIELWGVSNIVPEAGVPNSGFDFLSTATLDINPPPGVTVTLATGQVFGNVIPEPATLTLGSILGTCAVGVGYGRRRRTAA